MRYLRAFWAEIYREYIEFKRYPFEVVVSAFIFANMFIIVYMMAKGLIQDVGIDLTSSKIQHNVANMFVGYIVWIFAFFTIATIPQSITSDVSSGLLEQILLSPFSSGMLIFSRSVAQALGNLLPVVATGGLMSFIIKTDFIFNPVILFICLTLLSLASVGVGLILGGIFLIFKRASNLNSIIVWSTSLLVTADYSRSGFLGIIMRLFPISQGIRVFRMSMVDGLSLSQVASSGELLYLVVGSIAFLVIGVCSFNFFDKVARRHGLLGQY